MTPERKKQLLSIANASGFPFQLSVVRSARTTLAKRGWKVLVTEHPWTDPDTGRVEFIDLVLERDNLRLIVECKRVKQGQWVFLRDQSSTALRESARVFATRNLLSGEKDGGWVGCLFDPPSVDSSFCAVRGSGEGDRPLLERLAALTCKATESFATQELMVENNLSLDLTTVYAPVIVTNADLVTCCVDPDQIDAQTGRLAETSAEFDTVNLIRFRKPLGYSQDLSAFDDVGAVNRDSERTVLIAQGADLLESLGNLCIKNFVPDHPRTRNL